MSRSTAVRRAAYAAFAMGITHLVFGGLVRITGSGMGCGTHWPKCYGDWFPPMNRMDLVIEVVHRYLAVGLFAAIAFAALTAWRHRHEPGIAGRGGPLRSALAGTGFWFAPAGLGAMTVFVGNTPYWTAAHWTIAATLLAIVSITVIRAGGLGGETARLGGGTAKLARGATIAAAMALLAIAMGGLTAKLPGANVACTGFPHCGEAIVDAGGGKHVHLTHRALAFLLWFHLIGLVMASRKRAENAAVRRALVVTLGLVTLQLAVAAAMVLTTLPPVLRSAHQATGVAIWIATLVLAYLARTAAGLTAFGTRTSPDPAPAAGRSAATAAA